jgi:hypothetical protein
MIARVVFRRLLKLTAGNKDEPNKFPMRINEALIVNTKLRPVGLVAARCSDEHIAIPGCVDSCQLAKALVWQANRGGEVVRATLHLFSKIQSKTSPAGAQRRKPLEELQSLLRIFTLKLVK